MEKRKDGAFCFCVVSFSDLLSPMFADVDEQRNKQMKRKFHQTFDTRAERHWDDKIEIEIERDRQRE